METNQKIPLVKGFTTYKIIIPSKVERIIRFLCERIWDTEWSGVLFYTPSGTFEDGTLEIRCEDILPMDVGTTTYTEFNMSPDVISYMAQKPELLDCKTGLIHSHNNMSTFFSGTDLNTLQEEGTDKNHFVSLIVNNAGKYTAAITRRIKYTSQRNFSYEGFNGLVDNNNQEIIEGEEIQYFNLEIVFEEESDSQMQEIADRISEIKKTKEKAKSVAASTSSATTYYKYDPLNEYDWNLPWKDREPTLFDNKATTPYSFDTTEKNKSVDDMAESIVNQLLSGDVTCTKLDTAHRNILLNDMVRAFDKRFGKDDKELMMFEYWATDFIEFLTWYSIDESDENATVTSDTLIEAVIEKLEKLYIKNKYIDKYIEILTNYGAKF